MLKIVPDVVSGQTVYALGPDDSAYDAARMMVDHDISAVVVLDGEGALTGLVTERDLALRVVGERLAPESAPLASIMTASPKTVSPDTELLEALETMRLGRFRHMPVVEDGRVIGMVSMRDLRHSVGRELSATRQPGVVKRLWRRLAG